MKKSLIALAVLAASGASFAQSSVTLYGVADIYLASVKDGGATKTVLNSGGVAASRYGFKGTEDLGGGLKANFLLENGFDIDNGAGTPGQAFSRYAYVGFSGGFGEVRLGKVGTPYDDITGASNAAFDSALSPNAGIWKSGGYNWNPSNGFYYATPAMGGFSGALSHSLNEKAVGGLQSTAFNVVYAGGPLMVGLAYQVDKTYQATTENKFTRLNASYDLGVVKLLANYGRADADTVRIAAVAANPTAVPPVLAVAGLNQQVLTNEWQIGVDYPVSSVLTLSGGYARSKDDATVGYADATRKGFGLAAAYSLSKRTTVYGGLRADRTDNNSAADVNVYAVGIKHTF